MQLTTLARVLAVADTAVLGVATGLSQAVYDLPARRARWCRWTLVGAAAAGAQTAGDALWAAATSDRPAPVEDRTTVLAHESTCVLRAAAVTVGGGVLWWAARGVPGALRRRGVHRPNRLLAWPVGLGSGVALAGTVRRYHHDRATDVLRRARVHD